MGKNTEKQKRGFNIFNILLIVIILLIIAAAVYFFWQRKNGEQGGGNGLEQIEYVIEVQGVRNEFLGKVKEGDYLSDGVSQTRIGKVKSVETTKYYIPQLNKITQELVMSEYPDYSNLIITVTADAASGAMGYNVNGYQLTVGTYIKARFTNYECSGYCIAISAAVQD